MTQLHILTKPRKISPRVPYTIRFFAFFCISSSPHERINRKNHHVNIIIATPKTNISKNPIIIGTNQPDPLKLPISQRSPMRSVQTTVLDLLGELPIEPKNIVYTSHGILRKRNPIRA